MFIVSKRNFRVRRADGTFYLIRKDYAGDIPEDVFKSRLVQKAIIGALIYAPETSRDKDGYEAQGEADEREGAADIRPDAGTGAEASGEGTAAEPKEPVQEGVKIGRARAKK